VYELTFVQTLTGSLEKTTNKLSKLRNIIRKKNNNKTVFYYAYFEINIDLSNPKYII